MKNPGAKGPNVCTVCKQKVISVMVVEGGKSKMVRRCCP